MGTIMDDTKKMGTGIFPAARLVMTEPTSVELLLEQMFGAPPSNDDLPRTMEEEARAGSEALTGEPLPRCPDCGGYHDDENTPFGGARVLLIFID